MPKMKTNKAAAKRYKATGSFPVSVAAVAPIARPAGFGLANSPLP